GRHLARRARPRRAGHRPEPDAGPARAHPGRRGADRLPDRPVGTAGVPAGLPRGRRPRPGSRASRRGL
ncbi:MAG: hypothetical protein AVDCRST_MAG54-315, partial [uncultured Actinomycetospora sp.]